MTAKYPALSPVKRPAPIEGHKEYPERKQMEPSRFTALDTTRRSLLMGSGIAVAALASTQAMAARISENHALSC
jgi:hypothetical protein